MSRPRLKLPSPALAIATGALVLAGAGGAVAATVAISPSSVKTADLANGAVVAKKVNPTFLKKIETTKAGATGKTGAVGGVGKTGAPGAPGAPGVGTPGATGATGAPGVGTPGPTGAAGAPGANGADPGIAVVSVPAIPAGSTTDVGSTGDQGFYFEGVSNAGTGDARSNANAFIANGQLVLQGSGTDGTVNAAPGIAKGYSMSLGSLTALSYQWQNNVTTTSNGGAQTPQAPTIDIRVTSATADGGSADLIYTPGLNNTNATTGAAACSSAPITTITEGVYWEQDTFAASNCWFSTSDNANSTGGSSNPISIQQFQQRNPTAQIQSIAVTDGGGVGTAGNFDAGADDFIVGFNGVSTRYDFGG